MLIPYDEQDLSILSKWPLITRNKVESSKIEESVRKCAEMDDPRVKELASDVRSTSDSHL